MLLPSRLIPPLCLLTAAALLGGCIDVQTDVRVALDGSGVVHERVLIANKTVKMLRNMASMFGGDDAGVPGLIDEKKLRAQAEAMGPGVKLDSVRPTRTDKGEGYTAVFSFHDVNGLRLDQNPGGKAPSAGTTGKDSAQRPEYVTFEFHGGEIAELIVHTTVASTTDTALAPRADTNASRPATASTMSGGQQTVAMMKELFDGFRVAMSVTVDGDILETNAAFLEGSRVTLLEMDFGKLLDDPDKLEALTEHNPQNLADAKELMRAIPGIRVELAPLVRIKFTRERIEQHLAATETAPDPTQAVTARQPIHLAYAWQAVDKASLASYVRELLSVRDAEGVTHKGELLQVGGEVLRLKLARSDGGGVIEFPVSRIGRVEVFLRTH